MDRFVNAVQHTDETTLRSRRKAAGSRNVSMLAGVATIGGAVVAGPAPFVFIAGGVWLAAAVRGKRVQERISLAHYDHIENVVRAFHHEHPGYRFEIVQLHRRKHRAHHKHAGRVYVRVYRRAAGEAPADGAARYESDNDSVSSSEFVPYQPAAPEDMVPVKDEPRAPAPAEPAGLYPSFDGDAGEDSALLHDSPYA